MAEFFNIYIKVGGTQVLKQYAKIRILFYSFFHLITLGFSKTSLEILRLSGRLKTYKRLKKKYSYVKKEFENNYNPSLPKTHSNKVWVCWFQGIDNAPNIVKVCFEFLKTNLNKREVILITSINYKQYVTLPDYIILKREKGLIGDAHFSDLLRLELLIKYGGTWIDSTVLCTSKDIPTYIFDSELFVYQSLKPGKNGHILSVSNWLISSVSNNRILLCTQELLYTYWRLNNYVVDYFIFHYFFCISCEWFSEDWAKTPKSCNSVPHILLLELFEECNEQRLLDIKNMTPFHKLSYKFDEELLKKENTFYDFLFNK